MFQELTQYRIVEHLTHLGQRFLSDPQIAGRPLPEKTLFCVKALCHDSQTSSFSPSAESLLRTRLRQLTGTAVEPVGYILANIDPLRQLFALIPNFSALNLSRGQVHNPQIPLIAFMNGANLVVASQESYLSIHPDANTLSIALKVAFGLDTEPADQAVKSSWQVVLQSQRQPS